MKRPAAEKPLGAVALSVFLGVACVSAFPPTASAQPTESMESAAGRDRYQGVRSNAADAFQGLSGVERERRGGEEGQEASPSHEDVIEVVGGGAIRATARGRTLGQARSHALAALSRSIISDLRSELVDVEIETNAESVQRLEDRLAISSNVLLKGVEYSPPTKVDGDLLEVEATFTARALAQTAEFLRDDLKQPVRALDNEGLRARIVRARILSALMTTTLAGSLANREGLRRLASRAQEEARRLLNQGIVIFDGDLTGVMIAVDGEQLPAKAEHFIVSGNHSFVATLAAHRALRGRFRVGAGQRKVIPLRFMKRVEGNRSVYVHAHGPDAFLVDDVEVAISHFGLQMTGSSGAGNAFRVTLRDNVNTVGGQSKHHLTLFVEAYRGEIMMKKVKGSLSYFATRATERYLRRTMATKLVTRLMPVLLKALDSLDFYTDASFDYEGRW